VEVKLRLAGKDAHDKLVELLSSSKPQLYHQRNCFYDGINKELSSQMTVLRVRWFNTDEKVVITVKGKMAVVDGIGRAQEDEDEVSVDIAHTFESNPSSILNVDLPVIKTLKSYGFFGHVHAPHALCKSNLNFKFFFKRLILLLMKQAA
jgi:adenylate cyclase class IV